MRDTQKQRVYDSEEAAARACGAEKFGQTIPNDQLQAWVDKALAKRAVRSRWPNDSVEVVLKRGGTAYGYKFGGSGKYRHRITLPAFSRNPWVILHELAHCLSPSGVHHGPEFAGVYLHLVRAVLGAEAGAALLAEFRTAPKVRHNRKGIPDPKPVESLTELRARQRAAAKRERDTRRAAAAAAREAAKQPVRPTAARDAAALIRKAVKAGQFGPSGRASRTQALATARVLESFG